MNLQEKVSEASAGLRTRVGAFAASALATARNRTRLVAALDSARRELGKVARRHAGQFVKQNSTIAAAVRKDVSDLARATYASLSARPAPAKTRRAPAARKRSAKKAA
jgi:hypothetical protein